MLNQFSRTELILGRPALIKLAQSRVAVFGIGGVGSFAVEALVRSGIGSIALHTTIGQYKVDVAAQRIAEINPSCNVSAYKTFYLPETSTLFDFSKYDYIIDAIDTVAGKIGLVVDAYKAGVPIISAMGAGNKINSTAFEVTDIYKTSVCPLAHVMRKELRKRGIPSLKVVYSKEPPLKPKADIEETSVKRQIAGSTSFVPPVVGLILAGEVIKDLTIAAN